MVRFLLALVLVCSLTLAPCVGPLADARADARAGAVAASPVWAVRAQHGTVYLAGSVHVLRPDDAKLPPAFERAYADAEALVMEIDLDDLDPLAGQQFVVTHAMLPPDRTLRGVVGEARYAKIAAAADRAGLPLAGLQRFEPWMVAMTAMQMQIASLGLDPDAGVEQQLARRAQADRKPISGLETVEQQLGILDGLDYENQARFLELSLEETEALPKETDALLRAWRSGDVAKLERLLLDEYREFPTLFEPLVRDRNARWMPRILALLDDDDDHLVVVGTLHLVGEHGLLRSLERAGLRVDALP